ncbi:hypothetical protein BGZ54_009512 [Gamsiella multidivaricata]|nr:hypothetical protein BGZ54_009512 [Gamsiella multidivaricata]
MSLSHQVDIYQPPHQALDSDLMNPIMNRQLNNQYASNYHAPYSYHQQYPSHHHKHQQQQQQQQEQHQQQQPSDQQQQQRSNASTPTPTLASTLSTVSTTSTPSLSSNAATLPSNHDYSYGANNNQDRQVSPALSSAFQVPASPDQLTVGSHSVNMTQPMSTWTPNNGSSMDPELSSQQQQPSGSSLSPVTRGHVSFSGNASPKNDRSSSYYSQQNASHLYSNQQQDHSQQVWVASMSADDFHAPQEILDQDRQQHQHHQRSYSQSSRNYSHSQQQQQPSVASQPSNLPAISGLPLLSPTSILQSEYQPSSCSMNVHEAPTIMSHLDYNRVAPSMAPNGSNNNGSGSRYGPIRTTHKKSRTPSVGSQRDFATRTRTNSMNSTTSSVASSGVLGSLANTLGSTSIVGSNATGLTSTQEEDEDSDSPTTIQMRPRVNAAPRKAVAARVFECSVPGCTKAYTQLHNLKSHERTGHTPVIKLKPFHCIIEGCSKAFSQRKSLAMHIKTAHTDFKFKPFKCSQGGCQKAYTQLHNLRTHEKAVHLVDLSRKRVKNFSVVGDMGSGASLSPPFSSLDLKGHHHPQGPGPMGYHHPGQQQQQQAHHAGLGLGYEALPNLAELSGEDYHYRGHHEQQQHQHHHQQYARLPHLNPLSSMYPRS